MKTREAIKREIRKTREQIKAKEAEIMKLDYTEERHKAAQGGIHSNIETLRELHAKADANADQIKKISAEIYKLEIKSRILKENARAALFAEAYPVILKACEKYSGKAYGEATKQKIWEEVKKAGFSFYFDGSLETYRIHIYELENGYRMHSCFECEAVAKDEAGHLAQFITKGNKINIANVTVAPRDHYEENPGRKATAIVKAIHAHQDAIEKAQKTRAELVKMIPEGVPSPEYIQDYRANF